MPNSVSIKSRLLPIAKLRLISFPFTVIGIVKASNTLSISVNIFSMLMSSLRISRIIVPSTNDSLVVLATSSPEKSASVSKKTSESLDDILISVAAYKQAAQPIPNGFCSFITSSPHPLLPTVKNDSQPCSVNPCPSSVMVNTRLSSEYLISTLVAPARWEFWQISVRNVISLVNISDSVLLMPSGEIVNLYFIVRSFFVGWR